MSLECSMTCIPIGVLLFLGFALAGTSQDPPQTPDTSVRLEGTRWTAVEVYGTPVTAKSSDRDAHLVFGPEGRLSGADGCNRLTGPYTVKANGITFGQIAGTQMFCAEAGEVPNRFRAALKGTSHWSIVNGRLEFYGATGKPLAVFARRDSASGAATLEGTSWQLVRFQGGDDRTLTPDDRAQYTVAFEGSGRLTARIDCNRGRGTWRVTPPGQLELGPLALTRARCPEGSLHDPIVKQWGFIRSFVVKDGHLFLSLMADGGIFEFEPVGSKKE